MVEAARQRYLTAEELLEFPDDNYRYELVAGALVRMPPAGALHGKISALLARLLHEHVEAHDLGVVLGAETGFILRRRPDTVRAPDAAFVAKERVPSSGVPAGYWPLAPDLAVEVVSPTDRIEDLDEKMREYFAAGTRLVWVIHPRTRTVHAYRSSRDVRVLGEEDDLRGDDVLPGFSAPVSRCFE